MSMWLCRAGKFGEYENKFIEEKRIYCTWNNLAKPITSFATKQALQQYFVDNDSDTKIKTAMNWASQVWPFGNEMKKGEYVILPSKINATIYVGKITGDYEFLPENENPFYHSRTVDWIATGIPRNKFEQDILFSFGATMTRCRWCSTISRSKSVPANMSPSSAARAAGRAR